MILAMLRQYASISSFDWKCCAGSASSLRSYSEIVPVKPASFSSACISAFEPLHLRQTEIVNLLRGHVGGGQGADQRLISFAAPAAEK